MNKAALDRGFGRQVNGMRGASSGCDKSTLSKLSLKHNI